MSGSDDDACDGPRSRKRRSNGEGFWVRDGRSKTIWLFGERYFLALVVLVGLLSRSLFLAVGGW